MSPRVSQSVILGQLQVVLNNGEVPTGGIGFDAEHAGLLASRNVFGFTRSHAFPSVELHTSLLQMRGKFFLSPGFQPPRNHIFPLYVSAPAPSRGANAAALFTSTHS